MPYKQMARTVLVLIVFLACASGCEDDELDLKLVRQYFNISHSEISDSELKSRLKADTELMDAVRVGLNMYEHGDEIYNLVNGGSNVQNRAKTIQTLASAVSSADTLLSALNLAGVSTTAIFPIPYLGHVLTVGAGTWASASDLAQKIEEDRYRVFLQAFSDMRQYYDSSEECIDRIIQMTTGNFTSGNPGDDNVLILIQSGILPTLVRNATRGLSEEHYLEFLAMAEIDYGSLMFFLDENAHLAMKNFILGLDYAGAESEPEQAEEACPDYGTISWQDGTYTGELKDCIPHGHGHWQNAGGHQYIGDYFEGTRHGHGISYGPGSPHPEKIRYSGDWQNGVRHGQGTMYYNGGDWYIGAWANDKKHGEGIHYIPTNTPSGTFRKVGEWRNGEEYQIENITGCGTQRWNSGSGY